MTSATVGVATIDFLAATSVSSITQSQAQSSSDEQYSAIVTSLYLSVPLLFETDLYGFIPSSVQTSDWALEPISNLEQVINTVHSVHLRTHNARLSALQYH